MDYLDSNISIPSLTRVNIKDEIHETVSCTFTHPEVLSSDSESDGNFRTIPEPPENSNSNFTQSSLTQDSVNVRDQFFCTKCSASFSSKCKLDIHESGHTNDLRCSLCTTVLKNFKNYEKHVANCKPFKCDICGKTIRFRPNFIKHMRIHNPKSTDVDGGTNKDRQKYKCELCTKEFTSWEYFKVHKKSHSADIDLKCQICGKVFSALACLKGHQKVHTGEKPFK